MIGPSANSASISSGNSGATIERSASVIADSPASQLIVKGARSLTLYPSGKAMSSTRRLRASEVVVPSGLWKLGIV